MSESIDIYLVRHGEARTPWSQAGNSGLSELGKRQAEIVARELAHLPAPDLISSPLLRAQETAVPLSRERNVATKIDDRFREVPLVNDMTIRKAWIGDVMHLCWHEVDLAIADWRAVAWAALSALDRDTVIFTHFMLINAMVTYAAADERLVCFEPDYGSVTRLRFGGGRDCELISLGRTI